MANFKRKKPRKRWELVLKYWWRGMAKTNYRKLPKHIQRIDYKLEK